MTVSSINNLYSLWNFGRQSKDLEELLIAVRKKAVGILGEDPNAEDIAQNVTLKVWRSLVGDIKSFDVLRSTFEAFVSQITFTSAKDFYKYDRLMPVGDSLESYLK